MKLSSQYTILSQVINRDVSHLTEANCIRTKNDVCYSMVSKSALIESKLVPKRCLHHCQYIDYCGIVACQSSKGRPCRHHICTCMYSMKVQYKQGELMPRADEKQRQQGNPKTPMRNSRPWSLLDKLLNYTRWCTGAREGFSNKFALWKERLFFLKHCKPLQNYILTSEFKSLGQISFFKI